MASKASNDQDGSPLPPSAVLETVFQFLTAPDLVRSQLVCKEWRNEFRHNPCTTEWFLRQLLLQKDPHAAIPPAKDGDAVTTHAKKLKGLYLFRRNLLDNVVPSFLADDGISFRQRCQYGKYSRWVLYDTYDDPSFIAKLAWAVRVLCRLAPPGYSTLDGADVTPYNPRYSMQAHDSAPGWGLVQVWVQRRGEMPEDVRRQLVFGEDEFVGLCILETSRMAPSRDVVSSAIQKHPNIVHNPDWTKAMDIKEHTKLMSFLVEHPESLEALFWDTDGVTCRGVESLASRQHQRWNVGNYFGTPHPRQLPHLFNMVSLGRHVEAMSWKECCGSEF